MPEDTQLPIFSTNPENLNSPFNEDISSVDNLSFVKGIQQSVHHLFDENFFEPTENGSNSKHVSNIRTPVISSPCNRATSSPEGLETIEEIIAAAKCVYYRDVAKELETEKSGKAKQDDHTCQQPLIDTALSPTGQTKQTSSPSSTSQSDQVQPSTPSQQAKQPDSILSLISPNALNLFQKIYFAQKSSESTISITDLTSETSDKASDIQSTSTPANTLTDLEQTQALTMCKLQLSDNQINDPDFLKHLQLTHPEFQSLPDKVPNYKQIISNFNLKVSNVIKTRLSSVNKATLMLNAVYLNNNQSLFLFVSVSFYSKLTQSIECVFLGVRKFDTKKGACLCLKPTILDILKDFNLKQDQIFCCIYDGLDSSIGHIISNNTYRSFHDSFKQTIDRVFDENNLVISRIKNTFLAVVEQFCGDKEKHREFFERTEVYLHPTEMSFEKLDNILRTHRTVFVDIKNRGIVDVQILCSETNKWILLDQLHAIQMFCQDQIDATRPEKCITIDYIYPFLTDFLLGLKTKFNLLNDLRLQLANAIQSEFKLVFEPRKYSGLFAKATALNSQVCHYLVAKNFNTWRVVLQHQIMRCFCSAITRAEILKDFGSPQFRSAEQFCGVIFKKYLRKIEPEFAKAPPNELDFNYSAITFWDTLDKECVKEIAIKILQTVASPIFLNETLRQFLLDWISNQPMNTNSINLKDLETIERNCFIYLNRKFLL